MGRGQADAGFHPWHVAIALQHLPPPLEKVSIPLYSHLSTSLSLQSRRSFSYPPPCGLLHCSLRFLVGGLFLASQTSLSGPSTGSFSPSIISPSTTLARCFVEVPPWTISPCKSRHQLASSSRGRRVPSMRSRGCDCGYVLNGKNSCA